MAIALFVHDRFVRPFLGDVLAVMLVYAAVLTLLRLRPVIAAGAAFAFAFAIEIGQYFGLVYRLGLGDVAIARIALGTSFSPGDFPAYGVGAVLALAADRYLPGRT